MAGSQLTQLKSALSSAGLNRKSASKNDKKQWKKGGARETDRAKTFSKLEDIRKSLNKFDVRETKVKHDVGGRNLKGVTGRPSASKQAGLEQRRKTLLPEHQTRGHTGTFRDRRFGAQDPNMSIEDVMLERYTRERQKGQGKKGMFNIEDEDDLAGFDDGDDGTALGGLTHGGRSVADLPGDDFAAQGLGSDDDEDDDDEREGRIRRRDVGRGHFGGFGEGGEDEELPERKKTKSEVMSEIIAKSKDHKLERQKQKELDDDIRDALDEDLDDLRELLTTAPRPDKSAPSALPGPSRQVDPKDDSEYDQFVRTLAFDARAKPKDRTKTEDELALEEAEMLQKAEAKRLRRMRGEDVSDEEDENEGGGYKKRRKVERRGEADDLDDDFDEDDLLGPGLTREDIENMKPESDDEDGEGSDEASDDDDEEDGSGEDEDEDDEDEDDEDESDVASAMEDLDDEVPDLVPVDSDEEDLVARTSKGKGKGKASAKVKEIPFTFPCPASIEDLEDIMDDLDDSALPTVVQRIRTVHHPSLAQGNKEKLQDFLGVLLDYTLILAAREEPAFDLISTITPHIIALVKLNPVTAASHFIAKVTLMQKNLSRGLARGATRLESKTLPRAPELVLLRLIGLIWSTSDYANPVVVPAVLLMGQYLAQSRVRNTADIASGLFICSILSQYESMSRRLLPEAINFIASSLLILLPRRKDAKAVTYPELLAPETDLKLPTSSTTVPADPVDLASALDGDDSDEVKTNLVAVALRLIPTYAALYSSSAAFIEIFKPITSVLEGSRLPKQSPVLKTLHSTTSATLTRMLGFAQTSRLPLALQAHKPIPIKTFAPRFEEDFAPGHHYDPDAERNASQKLKAMYKKERKGAIRELRKDNRFLAGEKSREQAEKDREYNAKMRRAEGEINMERAEEKEMQREKAREKRRAGRR